MFKCLFYNHFRALCASNTDVSDLGVQWLCGMGEVTTAPIASAAPRPFPTGCKHLVSLFLRYSKVTLTGVRLAMASLNSLKYLDYESPLPDVVNANVVLPNRSLISFRCYKQGMAYLKNRLFLTSDLEIVNYIIEPRLTNEHLANAVDSMRKFEIDPERPWTGDRLLSFEEGIVPFLNRFGLSLQDIMLSNFDEVDPFFILRSCPRLTTLNLDYSTSYISSFPHPSIPELLERFIYLGRTNKCIRQCIGSQELMAILKSPKLKYVEISHCNQLTDSILLSAFDIHKFTQLETLILRKCNNMSSVTFTNVFFSQTNSLNKVILDNCQNICSRANYLQWLDLKCNNKWDLHVTMMTRESLTRVTLIF